MKKYFINFDTYFKDNCALRLKLLSTFYQINQKLGITVNPDRVIKVRIILFF
jgi:hypothetical protein